MQNLDRVAVDVDESSLALLSNIVSEVSNNLKAEFDKMDPEQQKDYLETEHKILFAPEYKKKELQNIGDIGIGTDYSWNTLRTPLQNEFPLVMWLLQTRMSVQMRNAARTGLAPVHKDVDGNWVLQLPYTVYTLPPEDTTGLCCWVPFEIAKCGGTAPISLLCLKDCETILDELINANRRFGSNDLTSYFARPGETVRAARIRMAKLSMAFFTAMNIILGTSTTGTATLKPFHGLLEVMENPAVTVIMGSNILAAMDSLWCRLSVLGGGNYVIAVHPLIYQAIQSQVIPDQWNQLPAGWTRTGNEIRFNNIPFIQDKLVPINLEAGTGEAWLIDGNYTGAFMGTDLMPTGQFVREQFTVTDDPTQGCASSCTYYWNYGTVFNTNPNTLARIVGIPLSANCNGSTLAGLDGLITPETPVPLV